jgi:hypothetical protein
MTMTWPTVTEYLCHKWPRIYSVCCNRNPVLSSFMTYNRVCSRSYFAYADLSLQVPQYFVLSTIKPQIGIEIHLVLNVD